MRSKSASDCARSRKPGMNSMTRGSALIAASGARSESVHGRSERRWVAIRVTSRAALGDGAGAGSRRRGRHLHGEGPFEGGARFELGDPPFDVGVGAKSMPMKVLAARGQVMFMMSAIENSPAK